MTEKKGFFRKFIDAFNEHRVVAEFEAKLYPPEDSPNRLKKGEIEFTRFKPGHTKLEVELKHSLEVPENSQVEVFINDAKVCDVVFRKHMSDFELHSKQGDSVPTVNLGDTAEIKYQNQTIAQGIFRRD